MIIIKIMGGLGNQMFQYALGRHLALKNDTNLILDLQWFNNNLNREYELNIFNIQAKIGDSGDLSNILYPLLYNLKNKKFNIKSFLGNSCDKNIIRYYKECGIQFQPEILTLGDNICLDGYWQSEKYFKDIEHIIRDEFIVKTPPDPINEHKIKEIQESESVSIHIRRGDYVTNRKTNQTHGVCSLDYYQKAIEKMLYKIDNPHFYIFSDDIEWAKANISVDRPIDFLSHNDASKNYEDLRLMSQCKHHIIANSSFSWWGAWLGKNKDQIVIAPRKWFKIDTLNDHDLLLDSWQTI